MQLGWYVTEHLLVLVFVSPLRKSHMLKTGIGLVRDLVFCQKLAQHLSLTPVPVPMAFLGIKPPLADWNQISTSLRDWKPEYPPSEIFSDSEEMSASDADEAMDNLADEYLSLKFPNEGRWRRRTPWTPTNGNKARVPNICSFLLIVRMNLVTCCIWCRKCTSD